MMKRPIARALRAVIALTLLLFVFAPLAAEPTAAPGPALFKLAAGKTVMYFFGSVHVGSPDMHPLPEAVRAAFAASDRLVVEVNINELDPAAVRGLFREKLTYQAPDSLDTRLDEAARAKVAAALAAFGLPYDQLKVLKPVLIGSILTEYGAARLGYDARNGIDLHFLRLAAEKKKKVLELETYTEQVDTLARLPEAAQIKMLVRELDEIENLAGHLEELIGAWRKGDLDAVLALEEKELLTDPDLQAVYGLLITERNKTLAARLKPLIEKGGTYFVVVGAGHFAGPGNIIELLAKDGFQANRQHYQK